MHACVCACVHASGYVSQQISGKPRSGDFAEMSRMRSLIDIIQTWLLTSPWLRRVQNGVAISTYYNHSSIYSSLLLCYRPNHHAFPARNTHCNTSRREITEFGQKFRKRKQILGGYGSPHNIDIFYASRPWGHAYVYLCCDSYGHVGLSLIAIHIIMPNNDQFLWRLLQISISELVMDTQCERFVQTSLNEAVVSLHCV